MAKSIVQRLTEKYTVDDGGCWIWHGATSGKGKWPYGIIRYQGRLQPAHRVSYQELRGAIPDDRDLDHLCRKTLCINPWHCEAVTHRENIRRGYDLKPHKTHCVHGHALTADNIYVKTRNGRDSWECRKCRADHVIKNRQKNK